MSTTKITEPQRRVLEAMRDGADLIVPESIRNPVNLRTADGSTRSVHWKIFQALLRTGRVERYKWSELGDHYLMAARGRMAIDETPATKGAEAR